MKKFTLLIVSLLIILGGVKAQPTALPNENGTLKAEGDYLKTVYTSNGGWTNSIADGDRRAQEVFIGENAKVLKCADGTNNQSIFDTGGSFDVSQMTNLHLDIYPTKVNENGVLGIFVYSKGGTTGWTGLEISGITANDWNSIDIDLSKYTSNPLSPISALSISGGVGTKNENNAGGGFVNHPDETEIYVANAYFYNDGINPLLNAAVKEITSNSVTLLLKGLKSKDATDNDITYTISYDGQTTTVTGQSGEEKDITINDLTSLTEYTFTITAKDAADKKASKTITVKTFAESAAAPTNVPDIITGYGEITKIFTYDGNTDGYSWQSWGAKEGNLETVDGRPAFLINNFTKYGSQWTAFNADEKNATTLHIDVYPLQDMQLGIVPITNAGGQNQPERGKTFENLEKGKWHSLELNLSELTDAGLNFTSLYQIKYIKSADTEGNQSDADGSKSFYVGNVYLYNKYAFDDEPPVILRSLISGKSVASATLRLQAYDNCGEVKFKVEVKKDGNIVQTIDNIKAKSEEFVRLVIHDLDINTRYTATVTATDLSGRTATATVKGIGENEDFFVTESLPLAEKQKPTATKYYYLHGKKDLRGSLNGTGWDESIESIQETEIDDENNKVVKYIFTEDKNVYGLCLTNDNESEIADDDKSVTRIAIYPVEFEDIEVAPRFYGEADKFESRKLTRNTWNYITVAPHKYEHKNNFMGVVFKAAAGSRVFIDNFCRYTTSDVTPPVISDFEIKERHAESVKVSFHLSDEYGEGDDGTSPIKYEIYAKKDGDENPVIIGSGSTPNPSDVIYYARGLKGDKKYILYVMAKDKAENRTTNLDKGSQESNFSYSNKISLEEIDGKGGVIVSDVDKGGKVVLKPGVWDIDVFNAIAAKYPYGCFDLRNVIFPDKFNDDPTDNRDYAMNYDANDAEHGLKLFNHNAYIIVDEFNRVNANYAVPTKDEKLQGMNFNWFDGDFTIEDGPNRALAIYYKEIIDAYEKANPGNKYPGLTRFGYIKCDPYIGETVQFEEQGAAMTRQMFTDNAVKDDTDDTGIYDEGQKANKYSTIICPFPLSTENIKRCEFYSLTAPTYNSETNAITLNFNKIEGMTVANTPYLIKVTEGVGGSILFADAPENTKKQLSFEDIEYDNTLGTNLISSGENGTGDLKVTLYGTYTSQDLQNEKEKKFYGLMQGNGEKLTLGTAKKIDFPAFRAMVAISGPALAAAKSFNICFDGEVTGIANINNEAISAVINNVYSIDGKRIDTTRNGLVNLPAGIYIVNGKKIVIK